MENVHYNNERTAARGIQQRVREREHNFSTGWIKMDLNTSGPLSCKLAHNFNVTRKLKTKNN